MYLALANKQVLDQIRKVLTILLVLRVGFGNYLVKRIKARYAISEKV